MYTGKLIFATGNQHKLQEARQILPAGINLVSLDTLGCHEELPETHETLHENALEKAEFIYKRFNADCFAEDTGLEVEALNGAPGVYSARYAGAGKNFSDNISLLLKNMSGKTDRRAKFRAVVALIIRGKSFLFEGEVAGVLLEKPIGEGGFGYDAVFQPDGYETSFAQMPVSEKNNISHRKKALDKLVSFLKNFSEE